MPDLSKGICVLFTFSAAGEREWQDGADCARADRGDYEENELSVLTYCYPRRIEVTLEELKWSVSVKVANL